MENHGQNSICQKFNWIYHKYLTIHSAHLPKSVNYLGYFWKKLSSYVHCPKFSFYDRFTLKTSKLIKCKDVVRLKNYRLSIFLCSNWAGLISEMELVPCYHPGVTCNGCGLGPIAGSRFKCKQCNDFDFCERCFHTKRSHKHTFNRIAEPSSAAVFAGRPGRRRHRSSGTVIQNK